MNSQPLKEIFPDNATLDSARTPDEIKKEKDQNENVKENTKEIQNTSLNDNLNMSSDSVKQLDSTVIDTSENIENNAPNKTVDSVKQLDSTVTYTSEAKENIDVANKETDSNVDATNEFDDLDTICDLVKNISLDNEPSTDPLIEVINENEASNVSSDELDSQNTSAEYFDASEETLYEDLEDTKNLLEFTLPDLVGEVNTADVKSSEFTSKFENSLLLRFDPFYNSSEGNTDQNNAENEQVFSVSQNVGVIPQNIKLLDDSISSNQDTQITNEDSKQVDADVKKEFINEDEFIIKEDLGTSDIDLQRIVSNIIEKLSDSTEEVLEKDLEEDPQLNSTLTSDQISPKDQESPKQLPIGDSLHNLPTTPKQPSIEESQHILTITEDHTSPKQLIIEDSEPEPLSITKKNMADISDKLLLQEEENSDLKLQLNASLQTKAGLELQLRQKEEIIIKCQAESSRKEQTYKQEIKQLKEKLEEKSAENDNSNVKELQETIKSLKNRETKLISELNTRKNDEQNYRKIVEEYEKTFTAQVSELQVLKEEHETVKRHLANLELAFSDVHQKYERSKKIIDGYKSNEDALRQTLLTSEDTVIKSEEKYESLKAHAKAQIEKSNQEMQILREHYESELHKLSAINRRLEIKNASLADSLDQKTKECGALAALCDEVTGKI